MNEQTETRPTIILTAADWGLDNPVDQDLHDFATFDEVQGEAEPE